MAKTDGLLRLCMFAVGGESRVGVAHPKGVVDLTRGYALSLSVGDPALAWRRAKAEMPSTIEDFLRSREASTAAV